jgi:IS605 OrfB family transposase
VPDSEYLRRTAVTRLDVDPADRGSLLAVIDEWKRGCQLAVEEAWGVCHTRSDVQQLAYDEIRERTDLGSQHAVLATHQAAEAIKRALAAEEAGRPSSKPEFTSPTVVYDSRTLTVFDDDTASLTTTDERVRCDLAVPADAYQRRYLDDEDWEAEKSTLRYRDGAFVLHLGFRKPAPPAGEPPEEGTVLGVAFGLENLAVTSTARFFPAGELVHRHREFAATRQSLRDVEGRNAGRAFGRVSQRERRYVRNELHQVANGIVAEATQYDCDAIAFAEIPGLLAGLPGAGPFHERTYEQLYATVAYKAEERGIDVVAVNPEYTRQRCTDCGFTHPENIDFEAHRFTCLKCDREGQADYNAAKNLAFRCIRRGPLSSTRIGATYCALQSGRVTPDGDLQEYSDVDSAQLPTGDGDL